MSDLKINTYPLHIGDWHSGTSRMSLAEAGAYIRLCNQYYLDQGEGWTVNECLRICAAMAKDEQKAVKAVLSAKFDAIEGGYRHSGMDQRISEIKAASERNQERARRAANARHHGSIKQCSEDATSNATSTQQALLEECDPKAKSQKPIIKDDDDSASATVDHLGWPEKPAQWADALMAITPSDPRRAPWQTERRSIDEYHIWRRAGVPWQTVIDVITDLVAKKRDGPPSTMKYFTAEILQTHADRQAPIPIPEPRQTHERRNPDNRDQSTGRSTDYMREAIDLDQQRRGANLDRASGF